MTKRRSTHNELDGIKIYITCERVNQKVGHPASLISVILTRIDNSQFQYYIIAYTQQLALHWLHASVIQRLPYTSLLHPCIHNSVLCHFSTTSPTDCTPQYLFTGDLETHPVIYHCLQTAIIQHLLYTVVMH